MAGTSTPVGEAISAALRRADELRSSTDRPARVRLMTLYGDEPGLTIHARVEARSAAELRAQLGLGTRLIPWEQLDERAGEIVGLVDEAVGEVTLAVKNTPITERPSQSERAFAGVGFEALIDELGKAITDASLAVLEKHRASREFGSEATMMAAVKLAALSAYTANVGRDDALQELRFAIANVLNRIRPGTDVRAGETLN